MERATSPFASSALPYALFAMGSSARSRTALSLVEPAKSDGALAATVDAFLSQPDLAVTYIDSHLAPEVQEDMERTRYWVIPTNRKVPLKGEIVKQVAKSQDDLAKLKYQDWPKINEHRSAWIDRFNREIKL